MVDNLTLVASRTSTRAGWRIFGKKPINSSLTTTKISGLRSACYHDHRLMIVQLFTTGHTAPRKITGKPQLLPAEELIADDGMNPIGTDEHIAAFARSIKKKSRNL